MPIHYRSGLSRGRVVRTRRYKIIDGFFHTGCKIVYDIIAWLLFIVGGIFAVLLVLHVESEKKLSFKFTIVSIAIVSFCIGYGVHFFFMSASL